jgi:hypothetical protein
MSRFGRACSMKRFFDDAFLMKPVKAASTTTVTTKMV